MPAPTASNTRFPFWIWAALPLLAGAWLRIRHLGELEPFVDEGALILTALDPRIRAIMEPVAQGRLALLWLFAPAGWFPAHALETARLMSAGAGLATAAALGWSLFQLAGRAAALCGLWLWAVLPFAVFHERLALQDSFIAALLAWAVALVVRGSASDNQTARGWFAGAGGLFGLACLFKISAVLTLPWLGLLYLAARGRFARPVFSRSLAFIALGALAPLLCLAPTLLQLGEKNAQFGFLPPLSGGDYWALAVQRLQTWCGWYAGYGGWPLALLATGALFFALRTRSRIVLPAAAGSGLSILVAALVHNRPFARYVLPDQIPLVLGLALAWGAALAVPGRIRAMAALLLAATVAQWGWTSRQIGSNPSAAAVPASEIEQYVTGPWSGRGLNGVRDFLTDHADRHGGKVVILTHRFFRPGFYGLRLGALADPRIVVVPYTVYEPEELAGAQRGLAAQAAGEQPAACFILYEGSLYPAHPWLDAPGGPARKVHEVPRGPGEKFTLYQFTP
jgi:hypothetical protein